MGWWDDRAGNLQQFVRGEEARTLGYNGYDARQVRQAVVHAREDMVLLVSHISSVNRQLRTIKWLLAAIAALAVFAVAVG